MAIRVNAPFQAVYIHEPLGHEVPALNTAWTVGGLFRFEADVNLNTLIVALYGTTAAASWVGLYMNADGVTCQLEGYNGGSPTVSSSYTLEVGRDYNLAIDYNGAGTVRMLLDGAVVLSMAFTPNAGTAGERSLQWGGYGELSGYTDCTIARWRMWSEVLTETEHRAEYRSLVPVRTSALMHNWPMEPGSGRFNDTIPGEPDLAENPAVPVGDGTAFIYRPSIIGTPQFFDLGQTTTPGAQSITVPPFAERVAIFFHESDDAGTPDSTLASLTSNFSGAFTIDSAVATSVSQAVAVATATVTTTGAGRTFTPTFTAANLVAGAGCWVAFLQDVGATIATGKAQASGVGATAGTANAAGTVNGLAIASDTRLDAATGNYPANQSGWSSLNTGQTTGTYTYWACSRIRQKLITATGTETATTQNTNGSCVSLVTFQAKALAGGTISGSLAGAIGAMASSAAGAVRVSGVASRALGGVTLSSIGVVRATGQAARTLGDVTLAAAGTVRVGGALAATLGSMSLTASGVVGSTPIIGGLTATLGALTFVGAGAAHVVGGLSSALGGTTLSSAGGARATGTAAISLGSMTLSATGTLPGPGAITGNLVATLGAMSVTASVAVRIGGGAFKTLGDLTLAAGGAVRVVGQLSAALGGMQLSAVGGGVMVGSAAIQLGVMTLSATGSVRTLSREPSVYRSIVPAGNYFSMVPTGEYASRVPIGAYISPVPVD